MNSKLASWPISLLLSLAYLFAALPDSILFGQTANSIQNPHELVLPAHWMSATKIGESTKWKLVSGDEIQGFLLDWCDAAGSIGIFENDHKRGLYGWQAFTSESQAVIASTFGQRRAQLERWLKLKRFPRPGSMLPATGTIDSGAKVIDIQEDKIIWDLSPPLSQSPLIVQSPVSLYQESDVTKIKQWIRYRDSTETWGLTTPGPPLIAELIGQMDDALAFRSVIYSPLVDSPIDFLVSKELLAPKDLERAINRLATMPDQGALAPSQSIIGYYGLLPQLDQIVKPVSLEGDSLSIEVWAGSIDSQTKKPHYSAATVDVSKTLGNPRLRLLASDALYKKKLQQSADRLDAKQMASELSRIRYETIEKAPLDYLTPSIPWHFRNALNAATIDGRLIGERGNYWFFLIDSWNGVVACLKDEVADTHRNFGEKVLRDLADYQQSHGRLELPSLETKNRILRNSGNSFFVEPMRVDTRVIIIQPMSNPDPSNRLMIEVNTTLPEDVTEARRVAEGMSIADILDQSPEKIRQLDARRLLRTKQESIQAWGFAEHANLKPPTKPWLQVRLIGKHLDSLIVSARDIEFLVDAASLDLDSQKKSVELLDRFKELRKKAGLSENENVKVPSLRCWGFHQNELLIGNIQGAELSATQSLQFMDATGKRMVIPGAQMTPALRSEIAIQLQIEHELRTAEKEELFQRDPQAWYDLKSKIRSSVEVQYASNATRNWKLKDSMFAIPATFEQFDEDDVIMRSDAWGPFRVYRLAFTEESLRDMERIMQSRDSKARDVVARVDLASVKKRFVRSKAVANFPAGVPVMFDSKSISFDFGDGNARSFPVADFHPLDISELRSGLYLRQHKIERDRTIDERLGRPVDAAQILRNPIPISQGISDKLSLLTVSRSKNWKTQLDAIATEIVESDDVGQLDAIYQSLWNAPYSDIGESPDDLAEVFLDRVSMHIALYKWQHGGDLQKRAVLVLERYEKLAPNSTIVQCLKAIQLRDQAWESRGTGFVDKVARNNMDEFQNNMSIVVEIAEKMLASKKPPTRAYRLLYEGAMSTNAPLSLTEKWNRKMMSSDSRLNVQAHCDIVLALLPRWGGLPGDSERYANAIAKKIGGADGDRIYAHMVVFVSRFYDRGKPLSEFFQWNPDQVMKGLDAFYERFETPQLLNVAMDLFAKEERWDLYRKSMELHEQKHIAHLNESEAQTKLRKEREEVANK